ncbi:hypothetical protein [Pararhizobium sp. PWRC1-1]|uniref:hypothetical protein n=1 Tax=Pararhizobium sp. PWRC1-1 TaxID=2804566 RepID=UPI003CECBACE
MAAAEDALAEVFAQALDIWPTKGVPASPDAWLIVAAQNWLRDGAQARKTREQTTSSLLVLAPTEIEEMPLIAAKRPPVVISAGFAGGCSVGRKSFRLCPNGSSTRVSVVEPDDPPQQPRTGTQNAIHADIL